MRSLLGLYSNYSARTLKPEWLDGQHNNIAEWTEQLEADEAKSPLLHLQWMQSIAPQYIPQQVIDGHGSLELWNIRHQLLTTQLTYYIAVRPGCIYWVHGTEPLTLKCAKLRYRIVKNLLFIFNPVASNARVTIAVAFQERHVSPSHGISVMPSGRILSDLASPVGSSAAGKTPPKDMIFIRHVW